MIPIESLTSYYGFMNKYILLFLTLFAISQEAIAGLDRFSNLDEIGDWVIERKIDSLSKDVFCRASVAKYGDWFDKRIRLNENNELIFPSEPPKHLIPKDSTVQNVRRALEICRSGLIYMPSEIGK